MRASLTAGVTIAALWLVLTVASGAITERISVSSNLSAGDSNGPSDAPALSANGLRVAFQSDAYNLVTGDENGYSDIFLRDRLGRFTVRVSVSSAGEEGNGDSSQPAISGDGRYVVFVSKASNLVPGDTNGKADIFLHDIQTRTTARVSLNSHGLQANGDCYQPTITPNGRYVAFVSDASNLVDDDTNGNSDVFLRDRSAGTTLRVSLTHAGRQIAGPSWWPSLSADARYVAFCSWSGDIVPGDTNNVLDVFLRDRSAGTTELISLSTEGVPADDGSCMPSISSDGRFVAFNSSATTLVIGDEGDEPDLGDVFCRDRLTRSTVRLSVSSDGDKGNDISGYGQRVAISADGSATVFSSLASNLDWPDFLQSWDVYVRNQVAGVTERASLGDFDQQADRNSFSPAISADATCVAFSTAATNLLPGDTNGVADIYLRDRVNGVTERISVGLPGLPWTEGNHISDCPSLSGDGRVVAFESIASNLVWGDNNGLQDVFVRDRMTQTTTRASVSTAGAQANGESWWPALNGDGRYVVFSSNATNLILLDLNAHWDIFLRDLLLGTTERVSVTSDGSEANGDAARPGISWDGRLVAFESDATNLAPGDTNGYRDLFLHDRETGLTRMVSLGYDGAPATGKSEWPVFSSDGRFLAFQSEASNLVPGDTNGARDVFVCDLLTWEITRVSVNSDGEQGNADCWWYPAISADGRYVAFESDASNLAPGDTNQARDVFLRDRVNGTTECVSVNDAGEYGNGDSWGRVGMSADARYLSFDSHATNLVPGDTNALPDVFVRDRESGTTFRASLSISGTQADGASDYPAMSANGRAVAFESDAPNLVSWDRNDRWDVFVRDFLARFLDVPSFHWAFAQINACADASIAVGYPDGTYHPAEQVTRAQMAVYLARAAAGGDENVPDPGCVTPPFPDVPCNSWAWRYILYVRDHGIASGYEDGYHPEQLVTRDQMAVFVARAMVGGDAYVPDPGCTEPVFPDVDCAHWARKYVQFVKDAGVSSGYPDGNYHPEYVVTRDQMAVYIARGFALPLTSAPTPVTTSTWGPTQPLPRLHARCNSNTAISGGQ